MLISPGLLGEMIDCPAKWRHGSGPHVPNVSTVQIIHDDLHGAVCLFCHKPIFANPNVASPYTPLFDAFLIEMTMNLVWLGESKSIVIVEEPDVEDLL